MKPGSDDQTDDQADGNATTDETNSDTTANTDGDTTGSTAPEPCNPVDCAASCGNDQCGQHTSGTCQEGICECLSAQPCLPCDPEACELWTECLGPFTINGACDGPCYYDFPYDWDAEVGCVLPLPDPLPPGTDIFPQGFEVLIDDMNIPPLDDCNDPMVQYGWWIDAELTMLTLCTEACAEFEQVGSLILGWGYPCD
ncbi:MAG: hypothetical protein KC431_15070 [Myxococcales bacterium]|nr:hypothetical protein [Myxococcales bacterium]